MEKNLIDLIFQKDGTLESFKPNYIPRPSQIDAAKELSNALLEGNHFLMEGPCGFGKTFAYLIPLCIRISESGGRSVIVTNGISLSEQLIYQDIPLISEIVNKAISWKPKYGLLKGKGNFICLRKFEGVDGSINESLHKKLKSWVKSSLHGDISELDFKMDFKDASLVSCVGEGECMGQRCPNFTECYYQLHKKIAFQSDIIVTNYHVLFSDWKTGGNILPQYETLILDEAHEAASIFRDFAQEDHSAHQINWTKNRLLKVLDSNSAKIANFNISKLESGEYKFHNKLTELASAIQIMERDCVTLFDKNSKYVILDENSTIPNEVGIRLLAAECKDILRNAVENIAKVSESLPSDNQEIYAIENAANMALDKVSGLVSYFEGIRIAEFHSRYVYFLEKTETQIKLVKKHIKVNEIIKDAFFDNENIGSVILTSATLSESGTFDYIKKELGLDILTVKDINEFIGQSPFNLTDQQLWFMPESCVVGGDSGYSDSMEETVNEIIDAVGGGILFLCTSYRNMQTVYDIALMNETVLEKNITVLKQGTVPNKMIAEYFRDDEDSILVATKSFYTGIDIPGRALRCVVIDKLPFPSPAEPVMARLNKEDGSFFKYSIPMMIMMLKQAIGRGVRSIDDKCVIAFMDRRIKVARYKGKIFKSFPYEKKATKDPWDIKKFLE